MTHYWTSIPGWFAFRAAYDRILAQLPTDRPSTVVEVGTWMGRSAAYLGVEIVNSGKPVTLVAVDHFKGSAEIVDARRGSAADSEAAFRRNIEPVAAALGERFRLIVSDSALAAGAFADGSIDAVWIDAAHAYEPVAADLAAWWPKVKPGGILGGDDFVKCPGVARAVTEYFSPDAGVAGACYWMVRKTTDGLGVAA